MTFNAMQLPKSVQDVFYSKNIDWSVLYWAARRSGISDENKLADLLFYHAHKEWVFPGGSVPLKPGMANYNALVAEWKRFKQLAHSLSHGSPGADETTGPKSNIEESKSKTAERAERHLKFAKSAVTYTRSALSFGAGNRWEDVKGSGGLSIVGTALAKVGTFFLDVGNSWDVCEVRQVATYAKAARSGNCGEHAAVAFIHLYDLMIRPIDIMERVYADHAFVVIGREGIAHQPSTWGDVAAVCDPWMRKAYPAKDIVVEMGGGVRVSPISKIRSERLPACYIDGRTE